MKCFVAILLLAFVAVAMAETGTENPTKSQSLASDIAREKRGLSYYSPYTPYTPYAYNFPYAYSAPYAYSGRYAYPHYRYPHFYNYPHYYY